MTSRNDKAEEKWVHNFIESFNALLLTAQQDRPHTAPIPNGVAPLHHFPVPSTQWLPHHNTAGIPPPPILYSKNGASMQSSLMMQHAIAKSLGYNAPTTPLRVPVYCPHAGPSKTPTGLYANTPACTLQFAATSIAANMISKLGDHLTKLDLLAAKCGKSMSCTSSNYPCLPSQLLHN